MAGTLYAPSSKLYRPVSESAPSPLPLIHPICTFLGGLGEELPDGNMFNASPFFEYRVRSGLNTHGNPISTNIVQLGRFQ